jgi:hypothetical protein
MHIKKILSVIALNLLISAPTYATAVAEKDIKFMPSTEALMKGEVHYALEVVSPDKLDEKYPDLFYLDSLSFSHDPSVKIAIAKAAYIVNKPAGFFDHLTVSDEKFLAHTMGEQSVKKSGENSFRITVPGEGAHTYQIKSYFDSDDISTLPNSKVIRAVTQARKMDVISQSASAVIFREMTKYSKYSVGGVQVSAFIPLKENKTLVLTYSMMGVKKVYALEKVLKKSFKDESVAQQKLINSYQAK